MNYRQKKCIASEWLEKNSKIQNQMSNNNFWKFLGEKQQAKTIATNIIVGKKKTLLRRNNITIFTTLQCSMCLFGHIWDLMIYTYLNSKVLFLPMKIMYDNIHMSHLIAVIICIFSLVTKFSGLSCLKLEQIKSEDVGFW